MNIKHTLRRIRLAVIAALALPLVAGLGSALLLASCDLDYAPENTYVDEKVYRTEKTAEAALLGAYVRLNVFLSGAPQDQNNNANGGYVFLLGDMGTDNLAARDNSSTYLAMQTSDYTSAQHESLLAPIWQWGYNAIDYANTIIDCVPRYATFSVEKQRQFVAEAKFIRAYVNLQLLAMFGDQALLGNDAGDGIVLTLEHYSGYNPDSPMPRSSNAQCWQRIVTDLTEAVPDLPTAVPQPSERVRATRAVAQALLARAYLWKGTSTGNVAELTLAADQARQVLANDGYVFPTSSGEFSSNLFPSNEYSQQSGYPNPTARSTELLFFEPSRIYTDNYPNGLSHYRKQSYYVPKAMQDIYDGADARRACFLATGSLSDNPNDLASGKYLGGSYDDVVYLRLAEVKLTLAEAAARVAGSVTEEAVAQLNDVHQRAFADAQKPSPYVVGSFATAEDFLRTVLEERRRELCHEGLYRWDLVRTRNLLEDATLSQVDSRRWNLPVPEYEIRITDGLIKQNTGYVEASE